jgi:hypothetical protein
MDYLPVLYYEICCCTSGKAGKMVKTGKLFDNILGLILG